mmetsp:Transcript_111470/g.314756  ORF Transcript_111470/g.314756 Transcript_111470/m.314756 type:complete len:111 (+) Transcript_111470:3-335(+)
MLMMTMQCLVTIAELHGISICHLPKSMPARPTTYNDVRSKHFGKMACVMSLDTGNDICVLASFVARSRRLTIKIQPHMLPEIKKSPNAGSHGLRHLFIGLLHTKSRFDMC